MKRIYILSSALIISIVAIAEVLTSSGKAGFTGSPGEFTCTNCHAGSGGSVTLSSTNMPNWEYTPGTTYNMSITVAKTGATRFGVGLEALNSSNQNAGTLVVTNTTENQILPAGTKSNFVHKAAGTIATDSKTFNFNWIAPATNIGNVTFYFAGNSANNNGSSTGDFISNSSQIISPANTTKIEKANLDEVMQVFPNPASNVIHIKNVKLENTEMQVEIIDFAGKVVFQRNVPTSQNSIYTIDDLSSFSNGFYFVKTSTPSNLSINKILIKK